MFAHECLGLLSKVCCSDLKYMEEIILCLSTLMILYSIIANTQECLMLVKILLMITALKQFSK